MAKVQIAIGRVQGHLPVLDSSVVSSETITSSAASQTSVNAVPAGANEAAGLVWDIMASGGDVWVTFGAAPVAIAGTTFLVVAGNPRNFGAVGGQKAAIIDA